MWSAEILTILIATFVLAGFVKGVIGLGLPTVALGILTASIGLKEAMAIIILPSFLTNVWQALSGGAMKQILKRLWPLLILSLLFIWFSADLLLIVDVKWLSTLLGITLLIYSITGIVGFAPQTPLKIQKWLTPLVGAINGVMTGLTGASVMPGVLYIQSLGWPKDVFVQAMGVLFMSSAVGLALGMGKNNLFTPELAMISGLAFIPAIVGMLIGQWVRDKLEERLFRKVFWVSVLFMGLYIVVRSLAG
jgi:hypothetical protein